MFSKIRNYLAVLSLSLMVGGSALATTPVISTEKNEEIRVDETKSVNLYNAFILGGTKHSYTVKVDANKPVRVKFKGAQPTKLKVTTPSGEIKTFSQDKFFEIRLNSAGEYVIELESLSISQYSLEVFNR